MLIIVKSTKNAILYKKTVRIFALNKKTMEKNNKVEISLCKRVIEIKENISINELAKAIGKSTANTLQFVNRYCEKKGEKFGRSLRIPAQTITVPINTRKRERKNDFYVFSENKDMIITKPCLISDIASVLGVTYLAAQKMIVKNEVNFYKNEKGVLTVPILEKPLALSWYQKRKIA